MDFTDAAAQERLIDPLRVLAQQAGQAIMEVYATAFEVEQKEDNSPLTAADRASHEIICAGLAGLEPRLPLLSEESAPEELTERLSWRRYWLVDPLDGTKEFVKRNGEFTVNIALIEDHRAVLGIVRAPALDLEYVGATAVGAWVRRGNGPPEAIATASAPDGRLRVVGSRSHPSGALAAFLERLGSHDLKPMGSSLKICLVADGQADVYPRLGPTSEWDTAAAQAVLESAGGNMISLDGQELRYNTKESLLNPHFLAVGDSGRDWLSAVPK
ncbi:MAG: 3'(2'),5'-bisphosphate nucleotidase CysQ [Gammaproteobacteria bacterium]|nr:3'(2'),5'-bisphosphate nucleotidase CysQ [Gammaproteobacteria bacterium]